MAKQHSKRCSPNKFSTTIECIQTNLRKRILNFEVSLPLYGCESQKRDLVDILQKTLTLGESNSIIIMGRAGSGKTFLLQNVLAEITNDRNVLQNLLQVQLNGYLQTDDRIAIKEITSQLQLENSVGDKVFGSFAENLAFLLEALQSGDHETKTVFFILDEFDLFCTHHNQTLLYNLFDIAQSAQTPIAVIGLTRRLDVMELLEKRVKSRFSHRSIHMSSNFTFEQFLQISEEMLLLQPSLSGRPPASKDGISKWNEHIKELLACSEVLAILKKVFAFSKSIGTLKAFLAYPVCLLDDIHPYLESKDFAVAYDNFSRDSKMSMLQSVSVLELCLILAMRRLTEVYDGEPFNFEMAYKEYMKFAEHRSSMLFDKDVVMKAFEHLIELEFVQFADGSNSKVQKKYRLLNFLLEPTQVLEAIQQYPGLPTEIKQWSTTLVA